jgi:uncharacterized protein (TIGR03000 family)
VMMVAMTTAPETLDCHRQNSCQGCYGGCRSATYGGCRGVTYGGCQGCYGGCTGRVMSGGRAGPYYAGTGYYYTNPATNGNATYPSVTSNYLDTNGIRPKGEAINVNGTAPARIEVNLPADAKLHVDSAATVSQGNFREFVTPPIDANRDFAYKLTVTVMRDQKEKKIEKQVQVRGGRVTQVDFSSELAEPVRAPNGDNGIQRINPEPRK